MPGLRTYEISYSKNGERKTFSVEAEKFYEHDEWRLIAHRFYLVVKEEQSESGTPQTWKSICLDAGYTDVTFLEVP